MIYVTNFDSPDISEFENLIYFWLKDQATTQNNSIRDRFFTQYGFNINTIDEAQITNITTYLSPNKNKVWTTEEVHSSITTLAQSLTGLSWTEGSHTLIMAFQSAGYLDVNQVQESKITFLNSHAALSVHTPASLPTFADVGGYQAIKTYLDRQMSMFRPENMARVKELGVQNFKGILALGVPGSGKSLIAKAMGRESNMLVVDFDIGKVMDKFVGGSEQNMRRVLELLEKAAGNRGIVVIMDEIEKQLAGSANAGASDAGATSRVHRSFLTWLNDRTKPVILVLTANNIDQIPPEFMRPGRVDSIWFFDLPPREARTEILNVHLNRYRNIPKTIDVDYTATYKLENFTGAEIEQLVKECVMSILHGDFNEETMN